MTKERQDAWSHEDDLLLAETVLRHIREGSTQLKAFDEVGDKLNRTSAACGFRWNAEVRQNYEQAVQIAKKQRKEKKRALAVKQNDLSKKTPVYENNSERMLTEKMSSLFDWSTGNQDKFSFPLQQEENHSIDLNQVIQFLQNLKEQQEMTETSMEEQKKLLHDKQILTEELENARRKINGLERELLTMKEDYQAFMQIVERARKMVVFEDEDTSATPKFRMDKNGNLEKVAK